jgi:hypothetical protein
MRLDDAAPFAAGLDLDEPWCPLPLPTAVRLFWAAEPIRVAVDAGDEAMPPPPPVLVVGAAAAGTLH